MRKLVLLIIAIVLTTVPAYAITIAEKSKVVTIEYPEIIEVSPGQSVEPVLKITVSRGYHVQANPATYSYLIPTIVEISASETINPGKPVYPKGKPYRLKGTTDDLSTYEGTFEIRLPLSVDSSVKPGTHTLQGKLRYQACDEYACLPPTSVPVELKIEVIESKSQS